MPTVFALLQNLVRSIPMPATLLASTLLASTLLSVPLVVSGQTDPADSPQDTLDHFARLIQQQGQLNQFNHQLLPPLLDAARVAMELHQYDEAADSLNRALQITRISEGLYAPEQIPLLKLLVENDSRRGDWGAVNSNLEHLLWLVTRKRQYLDADMVNELMDISRYHLAAVAQDHVDNQGYHYLNASGINRLAIRAGTLLWGAGDLRLITLQYELVKQYYLQALAIENGGSTALKLRAVVPGAGWTLSRKVARRSLYTAGRSRLRDMQESYLRQNPPQREAAAMVGLYLADWQVLFTEESAAEDYRNAYDALQDAGVDPGLMQAYFAEPLPLPLEAFHSSIASASDDLSWSPLLQDSGASPAATVTLSLGPLTKITRWIDGRFVSRLGVPQDVEIIDHPDGSLLAADDLDRHFHDLHFRPRLNQGMVEPVQTTFNYLISAE
jgi:hypothetical protein